METTTYRVHRFEDGFRLGFVPRDFDTEAEAEAFIAERGDNGCRVRQASIWYTIEVIA